MDEVVHGLLFLALPIALIGVTLWSLIKDAQRPWYQTLVLCAGVIIATLISFTFVWWVTAGLCLGGSAVACFVNIAA